MEESIGVLKSAAKTRRTPAAEVLSALDAIKKAKVDPSGFFETLGGTESPGRTWMLVFTAEVALTLKFFHFYKFFSIIINYQKISII